MNIAIIITAVVLVPIIVLYLISRFMVKSVEPIVTEVKKIKHPESLPVTGYNFKGELIQSKDHPRTNNNEVHFII